MPCRSLMINLFTASSQQDHSCTPHALATYRVCNLLQSPPQGIRPYLPKPLLILCLRRICLPAGTACYIQLNPLSAGMVKDLPALDRDSRLGHSVVMEKGVLEGHVVDKINSLFSKGKREARKRYRLFVVDGVPLGKRKDHGKGKSPYTWLKRKELVDKKIFCLYHGEKMDLNGGNCMEGTIETGGSHSWCNRHKPSLGLSSLRL